MKSGFMRYPRTTQERRANSRGMRHEYKIRARRNQKNLVEAWDDIWERSQRSWKKHRRTQYKEKNHEEA